MDAKFPIFLKSSKLLPSFILFSILLNACGKQIPPKVETYNISEITASTALSGGSIIDYGSGDILSCGVCWGKSVAPTVKDHKTSDSYTTGCFSSSIENLEGGTKYYVRAYAENSAGIGYGESFSFTTLGQVPSTSNTDAINVTINTSTLRTNANANYLSTTITFEYGTTINYGYSINTEGGPISGNENIMVASNLTGLAPGTTYHYRVKALNSLGVTYGEDMQFTTLGKRPEVTTLEASNIEVFNATFNGKVNPNFLSTTINFEYGLTTDYGKIVPALPAPIVENSYTDLSIPVLELTEATTYHYRLVATNSLGSTYGIDKTFRTKGAAPSANTLTATDITTTGGTINGTINPNYLSTTVSFEYGLTTDYGNSVIASPKMLTGSNILNVNANLADLSIGTAYHFRIKAENSVGVSYGQDMVFVTFGPAPSSVTILPSGITSKSAMLNGSINGHYLATEISFEWGTSLTYGNTASAFQNNITSGGDEKVNTIVEGLTDNTIYHFRVKATNSLGTTYGQDVTFTTTQSVVDVDGNIYSTVAIGNQIWLAENLKTTKSNDNSPIPLITETNAWLALSTPGYCWFNNDVATNKNKYGALYNWYAVSTGKLCPSGWHVPSDSEWTIMENYLIANGYNYDGTTTNNKIAKALGAKTNWTFLDGVGIISNIDYPYYRNRSGFGALPGGSRIGDWYLGSIGSYGHWWTSTESESRRAWERNIYYSYTFTNKNALIKPSGLSVRCIKD